MEIKTGRLILRDFLLSDQTALDRLYMLPETVRYNPGGIPENESSVKNLVMEWAAQRESPDRRSYTMLISDRTGHDFIGVISLELGKKKYRNAEVWYKLCPEKWGLGFATESLTAILQFGFETLHLHRIECGTSVHNMASWRVMEKAGMTREGTRRLLLPLDGGWHDAFIYGVLENEFVQGRV